MTNKRVSITSPSLRDALPLARKELGLPQQPSATTFDLLSLGNAVWQIRFNTGDRAEVTIGHHSKAQITEPTT